MVAFIVGIFYPHPLKSIYFQEDSTKPIKTKPIDVGTELAKEKNAVLTTTSAPGTFNISAMKPLTVPSMNSGFDFENISTFLANKDFRKLYIQKFNTKYKGMNQKT